MESRKIQTVGNNSFAICLPKSWVHDNNLAPQDHIYINKTNNNELLLQAAAQTQREDKSISVSAQALQDVQSFITLCYMKYIEQITITSKQFDLETVKEITQTVDKLEGYDITQQTESLIEISFLFSQIKVTLPSLVRRVFYLLRLMSEALEKKDIEALEESEATVDRLYFLSKRILFACQTDAKLRKDNDIHFHDDLFFVRDVVRKLENMGDALRKLRKIGLSKKDHEYIDHIIHQCEQAWIKPSKLIELENNYTTSNPDKEAVFNIITSLANDIFENMAFIRLNKKFF